MNSVDQDYLLSLVNRGLSDNEISEQLISHYPEITRGLSSRSVRRWRTDSGLLRENVLPMTEVKTAVREAVANIGPNSGRRFVKGYLRFDPRTAFVSEKRVSRALQECFPGQHTRRLWRAHQNLNPVPYHADYFGHKLHMDQNEKLTSFGVTHVAAIDGFSGMVVAHWTMPIKNNIVIYERVYRPALVAYGLWDQVVVDHGREFHLTLSAQEFLAPLRRNATRVPYLQIPSTMNNRIERVWPEANSRVNYPIKTLLESMVDTGAIDRNNPSHMFATSRCCCMVAGCGMQRLFSVRNARHCRNRGVPEDLMRQAFMVKPLTPAQVPTTDLCVQSYRQNGGQLTDPFDFGVDLLSGRLIEGQAAALRSFINYFIDITRQLS